MAEGVECDGKKWKQKGKVSGDGMGKRNEEKSERKWEGERDREW